MRTAMMVAQLGTVRATAKAMGVHRATVTRHIDALEQHLGTRLFLRHNDGYALTRDGAALRKLADSTDRLIAQFVNEATSSGTTLNGTLKVSSIVRAAPILVPAIRRFTSEHPDVRVVMIADNGLSQLELGEADIAVRIGPKPEHPDYVVTTFRRFTVGLYGHQSYFDGAPVPTSREELSHHRFVGIKATSGAIDVCDLFGVSESSITFTTNDPSIALNAIEVGIGLGMISELDSAMRSDLIEVLPPEAPTITDVWLVTHVDLHRTRVMQTFLSYFREPITNDYRPPAQGEPEFPNEEN